MARTREQQETLVRVGPWIPILLDEELSEPTGPQVRVPPAGAPLRSI